ncbi:MAG: nucleotidyltransferase domain-containing protein [Nanoarchaeota archaeon]
MKSGAIYGYIYEFLSTLYMREVKEKIRNIILFGSVASGQYDKKSDIDIFIDVKDAIPEIEEIVREAKKSFELQARRTWKVKGMMMPLNCIVGKLQDDRWKSLRQDMISNGVLIYGKYEQLPEKAEHYVLYTFSLAKVKRAVKMRFLRTFFGYQNVKGKKTYVHKGLIENIGGKKLGSNTILVPLLEVATMKKEFSKYNITPTIREVWIK